MIGKFALLAVLRTDLGVELDLRFRILACFRFYFRHGFSVTGDTPGALE